VFFGIYFIQLSLDGQTDFIPNYHSDLQYLISDHGVEKICMRCKICVWNIRRKQYLTFL